MIVVAGPPGSGCARRSEETEAETPRSLTNEDGVRICAMPWLRNRSDLRTRLRRSLRDGFSPLAPSTKCERLRIRYVARGEPGRSCGFAPSRDDDTGSFRDRVLVPLLEEHRRERPCTIASTYVGRPLGHRVQPGDQGSQARRRDRLARPARHRRRVRHRRARGLPGAWSGERGAHRLVMLVLLRSFDGLRFFVAHSQTQRASLRADRHVAVA